MDSDFEDKCQDISLKRQIRKCSVQKYLPAYIQTPEDANLNLAANESPEKPPEETGGKNETPEVKPAEKPKTEEKTDSNNTSAKVTNSRKRKIPSWQRGYLKKRKKNNRISEGQGDDEKKDSSDDSKDNGSSICPLDQTGTNSLYDFDDSVAETSNLENLAPLSINCDDQPMKTDNESLQSPRRRLSDLMSPSELLENPLDFDDIDQALNEEVEEINLKPVQCSRVELEKVLEQTVEITNGCSLQPLLDLYNQLSRIVKKYSNTHLRTDLPKELLKELTRFKNEASLESVSERSPSSNQST